jgi:hypothetical protein
LLFLGAEKHLDKSKNMKGKLVGNKMKLYSALKSLMVYTQNTCLLPPGEKPGFGSAVFLLSPSKDSGYSILKGNFLNYRKSLYKNYIIDFVYKDKFGYKRYLKNNTGVFRKEYEEHEKEFSSYLHLVNNSDKVTILKRKVNFIANLGEWNDLYFTFQLKSSLEKICEMYLSFISSKINDGSYSEYSKVLYIDIDQWLTETKKLSFDRKNLTNPISILLVTVYKFPQLLKYIGNCELLFVSPKESKVMRVIPSDLNKKKYTVLKTRLLSMINMNHIDESTIADDVIENNGSPVVNNNEPLQKIINSQEKVNKAENVRTQIMTNLTKNLLGTSEDITFDKDDTTSYTEEITTDDEKINEIKSIASNYIDEHPELLENVDVNIASKEVEDHVKKNFYINKFTPKYSEEKLKELHRLQEVQASMIGNIEENFTDLEAKTIDEADFSNTVTTTNPNIVKSSFVNFDKSYNKKKLTKDIDNAIGQLSNASTKVFVVDKKEEDTSTQLDLKKTVTYTLQDENGKKMKIKLDIPIIFDDHFIMVKGNKKIIQHQLILKPLVKTGKDAVQIVSNYQKLFIIRKGGVDFKTNTLLRYLSNNQKEFDVVFGNGVVVNEGIRTTLEYNIIAKKITQFKIGKNLIILNNIKLIEQLEKVYPKYKSIDRSKNLIIGINLETMKPITMTLDESFTDNILSMMPEDMKKSIFRLSSKTNGGKLLMYSSMKLMKDCPLILVLMYWDGFKTVMDKAKIEYELVPKTDRGLKDIDLYEWGVTPLQDGYIKWKRYPTENSLLMNGLNSLPTELYTMDELESKDTYMYLMTNIYSYANQAFILDQYKDFMIDPITKEILTDMKYPTDLVELCLLANRMLKTDDHTIESDLLNMRLRGNEVIAYHTYKAITGAYMNYRKSQHKKNPNAITLKQDTVITSLVTSKAGVTEEYSSLNPVLEISKLHSVSYKGESGTNEEHAMTLDVRAYNESMLGVVGITTNPDAGVGIKRQLTMEPRITSTRGYIDVAGKDNVEELNSAELFTPAELLTPLGVQHDDPTRTSMAFKQTMYMVSLEDSDPVLIGNGVEKTIPYHLSSEFTVVAEDDGEVVDIDNGYVVIKYNNGKYRSIDTNLHVRKNSAAGFYVESKLISNKKVGDKVVKNEVVAWDDKAFAKTGDSTEVAMRLGPIVKIAIIPEWDIYEDSAPITHGASEKMATQMVMPVAVSLDKDTYVSKMCKIGDKVEAGQSVITFDNYHSDPEMMSYIEAIRQETGEDLIETNSTTKKTHYTGTIVDIKVYTTVELDELSDSLKGIVSDYWKRLKKKEKTLDKYRNSDDINFYKSGNVITEASAPVQPDSKGRVKGERIDEGVLIIFYISFKDIMSRGDKLASEFALKSINSHVIDKGLEPFSEFHPDENIDLITAPLSISARKTPSIFLAMFGNKCLIEAKRHLKDYWENN